MKQKRLNIRQYIRFNHLLLEDKGIVGSLNSVADAVGKTKESDNPFVKVAKPDAFQDSADASILCLSNTIPCPNCIYMQLREVTCTTAHQKGELICDEKDCGLLINIGEIFHSCHLCNNYDICHACYSVSTQPRNRVYREYKSGTSDQLIVNDKCT
jgi:cytochrome c-type biogenesis protein CcmH/NrfF